MEEEEEEKEVGKGERGREGREEGRTSDDRMDNEM